MQEEPAKFLAIAANVLPKEVSVKHEATDAFVAHDQQRDGGTGYRQGAGRGRGQAIALSMVSRPA
jgi:hypothetical protein